MFEFGVEVGAVRRRRRRRLNSPSNWCSGSWNSTPIFAFRFFFTLVSEKLAPPDLPYINMFSCAGRKKRRYGWYMRIFICDIYGVINKKSLNALRTKLVRVLLDVFTL